MIDVVFPKGNESEFISLAERLGLSGICFVYSKPTDISSFQKSSKLKLFSGILCAMQRPEDSHETALDETTINSIDIRTLADDIGRYCFSSVGKAR
ncbi:MAG: hypothetical protein V1743_07050, partial [Nanoarchaeota archaeon]